MIRAKGRGLEMDATAEQVVAGGKIPRQAHFGLQAAAKNVFVAPNLSVGNAAAAAVDGRR